MDKASTSTSVRGASPAPTDLELEIALLRSLVQFKPTGKQKHVTITRLQSELQRKSGVWLETDDLWARLGELYDLEALDELATSSSDSHPASPKHLSPGSRRARQSASPLSSPSPSPSPRPPSRSADGSTAQDRDERGKLKAGGREEGRRVSDRSKGSSKSKGKVEEDADDGEEEDGDAGPSRSKAKGRLSTGDRRRSITAASGATPMSGRKGRDRSSSLSEDEGEEDARRGKKGSGKRKRDSADQDAGKSKAKRGDDDGQSRRKRR